LAAVIMKDPDWSVLPDDLPPSLGRLLRRCLTKDPKQRLQAVGEARIAIEDSLAGAGDVGATLGSAWAGQAPPLQLWRRALPWGIAAVLGLALAGMSLWIALRPAPRTASPLRLSVELGADASLDSTFGPAAALSRDGNVLAFTARPSKGGPTQLFVRRLDHAQATPLAGTEHAFSPFFSPDGEWIAFFADGKLKKISVTGAVLTLCDAFQGLGGDWGEDGNIVFAPSVHTGLFRVSDAGGTPSELTKLDLSTGEVTHRWPQVLPGGRAVLFTEHRTTYSFGDANVMVQSLRTGQRKIVQRGGTFGRYVPGG
jgi:serine/threonine-protein kinase